MDSVFSYFFGRKTESRDLQFSLSSQNLLFHQSLKFPIFWIQQEIKRNLVSVFFAKNVKKNRRFLPLEKYECFMPCEKKQFFFTNDKNIIYWIFLRFLGGPCSQKQIIFLASSRSYLLSKKMLFLTKSKNHPYVGVFHFPS